MLMCKMLLVVPVLVCVGLALVFFPSQCGPRLKGRIVQRMDCFPECDYGSIVEDGGRQFLAIGRPVVYHVYDGERLGCYPYAATPAVAALVDVNEPIVVRYDADHAPDRVWRVRDGAVLWPR
jgi:hypothetical protein